MRNRHSDTSTSAPSPRLILVHGSWHTGGCWADVQGQLAAASVEAHAPTLPGHGAADDTAVGHDDYVSTVLEALDALDQPAVLVGHSFGGSVISRVAELRPERCRGLIYYSAFVPLDGECVADSLPSEFIEFLNQAAGGSRNDTVELPEPLLSQAFANAADDSTLARIRSQLVPEPRAPIFERLELPRFADLGIPTAYITCRDDRTLPPGTFHPGQSSRLSDPEVIEIEGDHEALLTAPERLTDALLEALYAIDAAQPDTATMSKADSDRDQASGGDQALRSEHNGRHFVYKLIPPRSSFDQDATPQEQEIIGAHIAYWQALTNNGNVLIFGPVRDSHGASGLAVVEADSEDEVRKIGERDSAVTSKLCTYDIGIMPLSVTGPRR